MSNHRKDNDRLLCSQMEKATKLGAKAEIVARGIGNRRQRGEEATKTRRKAKNCCWKERKQATKRGGKQQKRKKRQKLLLERMKTGD